jgi:hypothetical protein
MIDNFHLTRKNASFRFVILHGHLWGREIHMSVIGEHQVTGGNGRNFSDQEGRISSEYGRFLAQL